MTGATARQRAAITISFGVQAALVAALLGVPALESTHHAQAARAVPAAELPSSGSGSYGPALYPMHLSLREQVGGGAYPAVRTDEVPWGWAAPPYLVYVPAGMAEPVTITVTNPEPVSAVVWFAVAPATSKDLQGTQLGISPGHPFLMKTVERGLPTGEETFSFTVPAADLRPGSFPVIVMGAQEGSHQVTYDLIQLDPNGDG